MIKLITIIGARPQIIKAAALSRAISNYFTTQIEEVIVHTGQHYDDNMSAVFFKELQIPQPKYNLNVGSNSHGQQTAQMIQGIEAILINENPNAVVLYGDTNSTLAGAMATCKLNIPIIHIEAGIRSFNKQMPEEVNRIITDHVSTLMFVPTQKGIENLKIEGFNINTKIPYSNNNPGVFLCGDVMYDNSLYFSKVADKNTNIIQNNQLIKNNYILATIHRNQNTDEPARLNAIFESFITIANQHQIDIVMPLHPRTHKLIQTNLKYELLQKVLNHQHIKIIPPATFIEMIALEKNCFLIMTDSGGVQKEAYYFEKPCIILREETEWIELVEIGAAIVTDTDVSKILEAYQKLSHLNSFNDTKMYGDGKAAEYICNEIIKHCSLKISSNN